MVFFSFFLFSPLCFEVVSRVREYGALGLMGGYDPWTNQWFMGNRRLRGRVDLGFDCESSLSGLRG